VNIPQGFLELGVSLAVAFVFKVVFGSMEKNEQKSDAADIRLHGELNDIRQDIRQVEERFRNNDRDIYQQVADLRERVTRCEK
jgi:hypothetical protein